MNDLTERFISVYKHLGNEKTISSSTEFAQAIGVSTSTITEILKGRTNAGINPIQKTVQTFGFINPTWLLTGKGNMLLETNHPEKKNGEGNGVHFVGKDTEVLSENQDEEANWIKNSVPLYSIEASAGVVTLFQDQAHENPIGKISIPNLPKCDGGIYVVGDSMYPLLKSHDIILYKLIHDVKNYIFVWGEMYLLTWENDGDWHVMVKWIQKSDQGKDYVCLVSENRHHQPIDIPKMKIKSLAIVKASIRSNSMI